MTRINKPLLVVLLVSLVWPPVFFLFVADLIRPTVPGSGQMRAFEIQKLLNANRWVIDIPADKDGWHLELSCKDADKSYSSGATSVRGGATIVLLTRRNTFDDCIEYAWYETTNTNLRDIESSFSLTGTASVSGSGSVPDPLSNSGVSINRPDGKIAIGDCLYRGGETSVQGYPWSTPAEFEVRVELKPPAQSKVEQAVERESATMPVSSFEVPAAFTNP